MFRKRVPVIVPLHEIANAVAVPHHEHQPHQPRPQPAPQPVAAAPEMRRPSIKPLRKNKRLRPALDADPHDVQEKKKKGNERDTLSATDSHASTVCSPASSVLASNDDTGTDALMKIIPVAKQQNIVWTKIKGHPYWPAQYVRISPNLEKQNRFKEALKFRRRLEDVCVMYFGTCEIAYVNAEKSCISWENGVKRNMHQSHRNRTFFQRALTEVKAFCHRNTRYPRGWWCEPRCFVLAAEFYDRCISGNSLHIELKQFISTADRELIYWAKIRGFPNWPVQVLPRNIAAERYPALKIHPDATASSSSMPCMFFGTGEVASVPEKNFTPFGAGLTRGYVTGSDRQDFTVALGEVWGYLQQPRIWPDGFLSGSHWWNYDETTDMRNQDDSSEVFVPHMPHYEHITKSVWSDGVEPQPNRKQGEVSCCGCQPDGEAIRCIDATCLNFASRFLCDPVTCLAKSKCANISFHKRKLPRLKPFFTPDQRGWGLKVEEPIKNGSFVIEYVGEIIDREIVDKRLKEAQKQRSHEYYMMDLTNDLIVDAKVKGNLSRFINSSCEPNCATQKWTDSVTGQTHVGIFAIQDIAVGTELTYNYCFQDFGLSGKSQKRSFCCKCGTSSCCMLEPEEKKLMKELIGKRLEVRWDDGWYPGVVETYNLKKKRFRVQYDDGDCEDLVLGLKTEQDDGVAFRLVDADVKAEPPQ